MTRILFIACVAAIAGGAFPALAQQQPVNNYFPTWYVGMRGAVSMLNVSDYGTNPRHEVNADPGFNGGFMAGIKMPEALITPLNGLSVEVEVSRYWHHLDADRVDLTPPILLPTEERSLDSTAYMVNAYYHFPLNTVLKPYIGGGIGTADVELERDSTIPGSTSQEETLGAWQGMVGLTLNSRPDARTEWNLGYRYFTTEDFEIDDGAGNLESIDNQIHSLELGMRLKF